MISITLKHLDFADLQQVITLSKSEAADIQLTDEAIENIISKSVENLIEDYLSTSHVNEAELTKFLEGLKKKSIVELLAIYYFFAKITYDNEMTSDSALTEFWEVCLANAKSDLIRIGPEALIEYLVARPNLTMILMTAIINIKTTTN